LEAEPGSKVSVAGTFNDWNPERNPMKAKPRSGKYATTVTLWSGRHEYRFVVNGEWRSDPKCCAWAPNGYGSMNSVITVN